MVGMASANGVFTWKGKSGNQVYSDTPRNLSTNNVSTMNIRSHTVTKIETQAKSDTIQGGQIGVEGDGKEKSTADQQAALNAKVAAENKKLEEENKKIAEQNNKMNEENCTRAKINKNNVETAGRVNDREKLSASYQQDIDRYCK
ncbi:DUF4124 domain-containing protein [Vitreoscilla massiliensis]